MSGADGRGAVFLAAAVPIGRDQALAAAVTGLARLDPELAPVDPAGLHVTVHFFGPLPASGQERAARVLRAVAAVHHPFDLTLAGLGAFPSWGRPRVLWLGCVEGDQHLLAIRRTGQAILAAHGFVPGAQPYRPHCTVARVRPACSPGLPARLGAAGGWPDGRPRTFPVAELRLMQSVNRPDGPAAYRTLVTAPLAGPRTDPPAA
ncbi:MAG TPA: RNA 2',3'-cyclic phosphodiesterase [Candidatus Micrarchaeia archaeon]|nr:RNA 2',3'-cyclic phosphodiesterase [Candidatus Micrarchaeia archaeon]